MSRLFLHWKLRIKRFVPSAAAVLLLCKMKPVLSSSQRGIKTLEDLKHPSVICVYLYFCWNFKLMNTLIDGHHKLLISESQNWGFNCFYYLNIFKTVGQTKKKPFGLLSSLSVQIFSQVLCDFRDKSIYWLRKSADLIKIKIKKKYLGNFFLSLRNKFEFFADQRQSSYLLRKSADLLIKNTWNLLNLIKESSIFFFHR